MHSMTFSKYSRIAVVFATLLFVTAGISKPSLAQKNGSASAPVFGSVDLQKCLQESKGRQQGEDQLRAFQQGLQSALQRLAGSSSRFLDEAEIREMAALYEKENATDGDKKRIQALEAKGDVSSAEVAKLQQVPTPNDAEKKRFDELNTINQKGESVIQGLKDTYTARLNARREELLVQVTDKVREAVGKIAKDKGLTVVFDAQVALYTANDITPDVIKQLNK